MWRILAAILCLLAHPALAEECAGDADARIARGVELRMRNQPEAALREFQCAYSLSNSPEPLAQVGLAEQALGRWLDADQHLAQALEAREDPFVNQNQAVLSGALGQVRQHLGALQVLGNISGAEVLVNGRRVASLPMSGPLHAVAGTTVIEVRAPGHHPLSRTIEVRPGLLSREIFVLSPLGATRPMTPRDRRRLRQALGWAALGGAALFLGMGIAGHVIREQLIGQYNDDNLCQDDGGHTRDELCGDRRGSAGTAQAVAIAGYAGSAVLLGTAAALLIPAYRERGARRVRVAVLPGPGHAGLALSGVF